jgi:hypothetical protein
MTKTLCVFVKRYKLFNRALYKYNSNLISFSKRPNGGVIPADPAGASAGIHCAAGLNAKRIVADVFIAAIKIY